VPEARARESKAPEPAPYEPPARVENPDSAPRPGGATAWTPPSLDATAPSRGASSSGASGRVPVSGPLPISGADSPQIQSLLPPGAFGTGSQVPIPGEQVPLPGAGPEAAARPEGMVAIPTADGGEKLVPAAPKKVVRIGDKEQEVDTLSAEERDSKRMFRNILMGIIGIVALAVVAILLVFFGRGGLSH